MINEVRRAQAGLCGDCAGMTAENVRESRSAGCWDLSIRNNEHYEYNEIIWDVSQFDAGLYLAEIKPNSGNSELVRLVVIK